MLLQITFGEMVWRNGFMSFSFDIFIIYFCINYVSNLDFYILNEIQIIFFQVYQTYGNINLSGPVCVQVFKCGHLHLFL